MNENELLALLERAGVATGARISVSRWSNGPGDRYAEHRHDYDKVLVVDSGSISFSLPELERTAELTAGDQLTLPAGTVHSATVGGDGVACLEAHLPAGSLRAKTATAQRA